MESLKFDDLDLDFSNEYYAIIQEEKSIQMDSKEKKTGVLIVPYINTPNSDIKVIKSLFSGRVFKLSMSRALNNPKAATYQIRDSSTGAPILRIDINKKHNTKIPGSHVHFFDPFNEDDDAAITLPLSYIGVEKGKENPIEILKDMLEYFHVNGFKYIIEIDGPKLVY